MRLLRWLLRVGYADHVAWLLPRLMRGRCMYAFGLRCSKRPTKSVWREGAELVMQPGRRFCKGHAEAMIWMPGDPKPTGGA